MITPFPFCHVTKRDRNCHTSPCKTACPAHIAIQGYLQFAKEGKYLDALKLIKKDNPLPAICGSICNKYYEAECTRAEVDDAVAIDDVKRFVAELDLNSDEPYIPEPTVPSLKGKFDQKIAIIGAGPAGLSCAYNLALKGYKPTVFEKNEKPGGMLMYGIPNFKLEKDILEAEVDIIKKMGVDFKFGVEIGKDITLNDLRDKGYKGFFLGIGCQAGRLPGIKGQDADGVYTAVDFLRECTTNQKSDIDGNVVVVGGGNVAIDAARCARRFTDGDITMLSLESADEMPAKAEEIEEALADDIKIKNSWGPKEVIVNDEKVEGIVFKKCTRVFDDDNRFSPQYDEEDTMKISCDKVIFSIGQAIEWGDLLKDENVELLPNGGVIANKLTMQTSQDDIFVAGDVYTGPKFAIDAIAGGREAAISLHRFVQENCTLTIGRNRRDFIALDKKNITIGEHSNDKRQKNDITQDDKPSFKKTVKTFSETQTKKEAARCLKCGASFVDENKCIGCGICTTKCVFDAISLSRECPENSTMITSEDKLKVILPNMAKLKISTAFKSKKF